MNPCCEKDENLSDPQPVEGNDATIRVCKVCGRRHFEVTLDPLKLNFTGSGL